MRLSSLQIQKSENMVLFHSLMDDTDELVRAKAGTWTLSCSMMFNYSRFFGLVLASISNTIPADDLCKSKRIAFPEDLLVGSSCSRPCQKYWCSFSLQTPNFFFPFLCGYLMTKRLESSSNWESLIEWDFFFFLRWKQPSLQPAT